MTSVIIVFVCLMAVLIPGSHSIKGGTPISIDQAPYIMQLWHKNKGFFCGGTLIADRFVVTAAHCLDRMNYELITVVGGASKLTDKGVRRKVIDAYISIEYNNVTNDSDVVLLKLDDDMKGTNIKTVALCNQSLKTGDYIQVEGWGVTSYKGELSEVLRRVQLPLIDQDKCTKLHFKGEVTDNMMCAADKGKDACSADSGGPALFGGKLCGIVSWGIDCGRPENPGVFTRLNKVRWFIDAVLEM